MDKKHVWVILLIAAVAFGFFAASAYWGKFASWNEKAAIAASSQGDTITTIQGRVPPVLKVGIRATDMLGMIKHVSETEKEGMEADIAKAIATAVLGKRYKIDWVPVGLTTRFTAIDNDDVDVVLRSVTLNARRDIMLEDTGNGYGFGPIYYYDGTNVILYDDAPTTGVNIIVADGSSNQDDLEKYSHRLPSTWTIIPALATATQGASAVAEAAFEAEEYNGVTIHGYAGDGVACKHFKQKLVIDNELHFTPPLSKSPLAIMVKEGDTNWSEVVSWVFHVLVAAEEEGYGKGDTSDPSLAINGLPNPGWGPTVPGLPAHWARAVISEVGNYAEIWKRNFGTDPRGDNTPGYEGDGLLYPPPF